MKKFADLHCHTHIRSFSWLRHHKRRHIKRGQYSSWTIVAHNRGKSYRQGRKGSSYNQSDLESLVKGGVRLVFNSLYPVEKEFFKMASSPAGNDKRGLRTVIWWLSHEDVPLRDWGQGYYMRLPQPLINFYQSNKYDYWEYLKEEYEFVVKDSGKASRTKVVIPGIVRKTFESKRRWQRDRINAAGMYVIPKSKEELEVVMHEDENIVMILTIEGAHIFGTDQTMEIEVLKSRVAALKAMSHPIFFFTFAHHFNNFLCGHAHSFPDIGTWLFNQKSGMKNDFSPEGRIILRQLLAIDEQGNSKPEDGYRILIDLKHMNARSRKSYYKMIKAFPHASEEEGANQIPVIASHCGYSGIKDLKSHMDIMDAGTEENDFFDSTGKFNAWNINMCDEDIKVIFYTKGLLGLSFDQRILGVAMGKKVQSKQRNNIGALWENIKGIAEVIYQETNIPAAEKEKVWNIMTIGTDFDGHINPIDKFKTAKQFGSFRSDLLCIMKKEVAKEVVPACLQAFTSHEDIEKIVDNICYQNAADFVIQHYPDKVNPMI